METKHTPEPWKIGKDDSKHLWSDHTHLGMMFGHSTKLETDEANAKRIVECVNACSGMENPTKNFQELTSELNRWRHKFSNTQLEKLQELKQQRDDLIAVLTNIEAILESGSTITPKSLIRGAVCIALGKDPSVIM